MVGPISIDHDLVNSLDLDAALAASHQGNLFPSYVGYVAADGDVVASVRGQLSRGYRPMPLEVVRVPKLDRSTRPALDMGVEDRIAYAALADAVKRAVHPGLVTFTGLGEEGESYTDFERFPLGQEDARYVLEADVASFYEYVDHQRLADEIVGLTGVPALADSVADVLERWLGRPFGLPQGPPPSAILADVYVSAAARVVARAGLRFARYSDDFRIVAASWSEARRAQLILETALRSVGLVVAPRKLRTPKIETYRAALDRANDPRLRSGVEIPGAEELLADEYTAEDEDTAVRTTAEEASAADEVLRELIQQTPIGVTETRLARAALRRLRGHSARTIYTNLNRLLSRYAHITQSISASLRLAMDTDEESAALEAIEGWLRQPWFRYGWQVGWLLYAVNHASEPRQGIGEWASEMMFDSSVPWFARGQAAIAAARHGDLPPIERYFDLWERAPDAAKPDLVAAVVLGEPEWAEGFIHGAQTSILLSKVAQLPPGAFRDWL